MITEKMLAVLLAGLITLSLAGCAADKANDHTESGAVSTESSITVTDKTSEPTAESSLPAGTESTTDSTTEKEKESNAPADSGKTEAAKPADTELPKQTEPPQGDRNPKTDRVAEGHGAAGNQTDRAAYEAHRTAAHRASCNGAAEGLHRGRPYTHRVRG